MVISTRFLLILLAGFVGLAYSEYHPGFGNKTFVEAKKDCEARGYTLLTPFFEAKNIEIYNLMKAHKLKRVWLGVSRTQLDTDQQPWAWRYNGVRSDVVRKHYWGPSEPNNYKKHSERCVEMRDLAKNNATSNWNDRPCDSLNPYVCESL